MRKFQSARKGDLDIASAGSILNDPSESKTRIGKKEGTFSTPFSDGGYSSLLVGD